MINEIKIFNMRFLFGNTRIIEELKKAISFHTVNYICVINANIVINVYNNSNYNKIINNAIFNICDGSILAIIISIIQKIKLSPYPGPDLFIDIIKLKKFNSFFLGTNSEVKEKLFEKLIKIDENIVNMGWYCPPYMSVDKFNYEEIASKIKEKNPDIVWVSLGAPKQEYFISNLIKYLDKVILIGVGQAFTTIAYSNRAPKIIRKLKLEWLYRLFVEPGKTFKRLLKEIWYLPQIIANEIINR